MGLVIPNLAHSFFAQLAVELSGVLRSNGFTLVISSSEEDPELEKREIDHLLARGVDALLIASTQPSPETPYSLRLVWLSDARPTRKNENRRLRPLKWHRELPEVGGNNARRAGD
jgi:hypothetical protein